MTDEDVLFQKETTGPDQTFRLGFCVGLKACPGDVFALCGELGAGAVRELEGEPENMVFALPKELRVRLVD